MANGNMKKILAKTSIIDEALNAKFKDIEKEYFPEDEIFDSEIAHKLRRLSNFERRLIILYAELGSVLKLAKIFNCSHSLILYKIKNIREKVKK